MKSTDKLPCTPTSTGIARLMICLHLSKPLPIVLGKLLNDFMQRLSVTSIAIGLGITFALNMTAVQASPALINQ